LADANESAGIECDGLADSLLVLEEPSVRAYFIAAQVANLRKNQNKAISILERVAKIHPDEIAPIGIVVPVKIAAYFWIATIAKQSGEIVKAKNQYEEVLRVLEGPGKITGLDDTGGLIMMCHLKLAEMESAHFKNNERTIAHLKSVEKVRKPSGDLGNGYDIYKSWAAYQYSRLYNNNTEAARKLIGEPGMIYAPLFAVTQLQLAGIIGQPLAGYCGRDKRAEIIGKTLFDRTIQNDSSSTDRVLVNLVYAYVYQENKKFAEAEKYYSSILQEDSFFSPIAGIYLAQCKKKQGNTPEAEKVLDQVTAKYPGFKFFVDQTKQSWK